MSDTQTPPARAASPVDGAADRPVDRPGVDAFVAQLGRDVERAVTVLRATGTLTAAETFVAWERVPGADLVALAGHPGPWAQGAPLRTALTTVAEARHAAVFQADPTITTVVHVHAPYLGAWAQTHRPLPLRYAASQRLVLAREIPAYVDRRRSEADFIADQLALVPSPPAILEANGGATVWGRSGLIAVAQLILQLEEGAKLQALADGLLGGSREFGPAVIAQQWAMTGLLEEARALGLAAVEA